MTDKDRMTASLSRRGFVGLGIGALTIAALPVAALRRRRVVRRTIPVMGTIADVVVVSGSAALAQGAIEASLSELRRIEALMTRFEPTSDIGRVNAARPGEAVPVSRETAEVVAEALRWAQASDGAYDPAIGSAVQLWDVTNRHEPPSRELVARLADRAFHLHVEVGTFRGTSVIVRRDADARLDLGGIAKGYGVDRAVAALRDWGVANAVVDVGGDLYALGDGVDGDGWRVGIQSPHSAGDIARVVRVSDAAIATSGTYAQFFTHQGRRYHHLLDPQLAAPRATIVQSLTLRADTCMHADVAATACYGQSRESIARTLAARAPGSAVVSTI